MVKLKKSNKKKLREKINKNIFKSISRKPEIKKDNKRIELSSKEFRINLERLQRDVKDAYSSMKKILPEAIKELKVTKFGNAGHIILPKEYVGKSATVIVRKGPLKKGKE